MVADLCTHRGPILILINGRCCNEREKDPRFYLCRKLARDILVSGFRFLSSITELCKKKKKKTAKIRLGLGNKSSRRHED